MLCIAAAALSVSKKMEGAIATDLQRFQVGERRNRDIAD